MSDLRNYIYKPNKDSENNLSKMIKYAYESAAIDSGDPEADITFLGIIEFDDTDNYVNEETLGTVDMKRGVNRVVVEFRTLEGWEKPHIHVHNDHFKTAIRLDVAEYFLHSPYTDVLTNKQAKIFDEFMRTKVDGNTTRWQLAKGLFNANFAPDHKFSVDEQPDYTKLEATEKQKKTD